MLLELCFFTFSRDEARSAMRPTRTGVARAALGVSRVSTHAMGSKKRARHDPDAPMPEMRDQGGLAADARDEARDLERHVGDRLDDVEGVHREVAVGRHVLLEVHADGGAGDARAGEAEDKARAIGEDETDSLRQESRQAKSTAREGSERVRSRSRTL